MPGTDKDYTGNGIKIDFFGKKAIMPKGPAVISLRTGAPIVFCALIREKNDTYIMNIEEPIKFTPTGNYEEDEKALMKQYLEVFEHYIKKYNDQWYAFRRIWVQE